MPTQKLETLKQARLEIANKHNYYDWDDLIKHEICHDTEAFKKYNDEASLLAMERIAEMSLKRKDQLEEWLTEYRDQLKKENAFHKNTGIINAINELLNL